MLRCCHLKPYSHKPRDPQETIKLTKPSLRQKKKIRHNVGVGTVVTPEDAVDVAEEEGELPEDGNKSKRSQQRTMEDRKAQTETQVASLPQVLLVMMQRPTFSTLSLLPSSTLSRRYGEPY